MKIPTNEINEPFDGLSSFDINNPDKNGLIWNSDGSMIDRMKEHYFTS